jgi:hypothetical protein
MDGTKMATPLDHIVAVAEEDGSRHGEQKENGDRDEQEV